MYILHIKYLPRLLTIQGVYAKVRTSFYKHKKQRTKSSPFKKSFSLIAPEAERIERKTYLNNLDFSKRFNRIGLTSGVQTWDMIRRKVGNVNA